jgi:hypothetical protein
MGWVDQRLRILELRFSHLDPLNFENLQAILQYGLGTWVSKFVANVGDYVFRDVLNAPVFESLTPRNEFGPGQNIVLYRS